VHRRRRSRIEGSGIPWGSLDPAVRIGHPGLSRHRGGCRLDRMERPEATRPSMLADIQQRIGELLRSSPAPDLERNLKALVAQAFDRFDLVTREELEAHRAVIDALEARVVELERALDAQAAPGATERPAPATPPAGPSTATPPEDPAGPR